MELSQSKYHQLIIVMSDDPCNMYPYGQYDPYHVPSFPNLPSDNNSSPTSPPATYSSSSSTPFQGPSLVATPSGSSSGRHPVYHGIRFRAGKWVTEIREPRKTSRIWLGTYPTPEMAAAAYDVAALALRGRHATLNFPDSVLPSTLPRSPTAADIRAAAASVAEARAPAPKVVFPPEENSGGYVDEEELYNMPDLLAGMAEGMMLSPPRFKSDDDDPPENIGGDSLWSYYP